MSIPTFSTLLHTLTVPSHDDGTSFTDTTRLDAIRTLLYGSSYHVVEEGSLFLLYGQQPLHDEEIILVSTHVDCVYSQCFCTECDGYYLGTFDNSLTNAAVIYNMLHQQLPPNVYIAFTGDEEHDSGGCHELVYSLSLHAARCGCRVRFALVTDVTNEGWQLGAAFSIENDLGIDLFTASRIVHTLQPFLYTFVHDAEPDESWDYDEYHIPTFTLCIPVSGNLHSDEGVLARPSAIPQYCQVMSLLIQSIEG